MDYLYTLSAEIQLETESQISVINQYNMCQSTILAHRVTVFLPCISFLFSNFIYLWLCWVFVAARGLSLVAASGSCSSLQCAGFPLRWLLLLWSMGSRCVGFSSCGMWAQQACGLQRAGSVVVAHGLTCSTACGIFRNQGSNLCPLHWQEDS